MSKSTDFRDIFEGSDMLCLPKIALVDVNPTDSWDVPAESGSIEDCGNIYEYLG
jgi:hypothetical protein